MKKCRYCGHEYNELDTEFEFESKSFCSERCKNGYLETLKRRYNKQYETDDDYVECKVCGIRMPKLNGHIKAYHFPLEKYFSLYNISDNISALYSKNAIKNMSNGQKNSTSENKHRFTSDNNPSKSKECKNGEMSPFSKNFKKYDGLSEDEKEYRIRCLLDKCNNKKIDNGSNNTTIDFYNKI